MYNISSAVTLEGQFTLFDVSSDSDTSCRGNDNVIVYDISEITSSRFDKLYNYRIEGLPLDLPAKKKFKCNIDAINLLKTLESEERRPDSDEMLILSSYLGWGGIAQAFDANNKEWSSEYSLLKSLLTESEYEAARASTLTAYYTPIFVINAIYSALSSFGVSRGNILEPSCGIGNFFGLVPDSLSDARFYGVEIDSITGRIAKYLYPNYNIQTESFEKSSFADSFFDAAIGNVPFGNFKVYDKRYEFQSTLPVWGATVVEHYAHLACIISIHAPRVGSDTRRPEKERRA